ATAEALARTASGDLAIELVEKTIPELRVDLVEANRLLAAFRATRPERLALAKRSDADQAKLTELVRARAVRRAENEKIGIFVTVGTPPSRSTPEAHAEEHALAKARLAAAQSGKALMELRACVPAEVEHELAHAGAAARALDIELRQARRDV